MAGWAKKATSGAVLGASTCTCSQDAEAVDLSMCLADTCMACAACDTRSCLPVSKRCADFSTPI